MQHIINTSKIKALSISLPGLVFLCLAFPAGLKAIPGIDSLASEFHGSANSFQKVRILRSVGNQIADNKGTVRDKKVFEEMIKTGLRDGNASVVGEAVYSAGRSNNQVFIPDLIDLYHNGCHNFPGSQTLLKRKVLTVMLSFGDNKTEDLIIEILDRKTIDKEMEYLLTSLCRYKKCPDSIIPHLIGLRDAIASVLKGVKDTPENSIAYSRDRRIYALTNELISRNTLDK